MGSVLIVLAVLLLASCTGYVKEQTSPTAAPAVKPGQDTGERQKPPSSDWGLSPQSDNAGQVTIEVTPLTLSDDVWEFNVALNTHSVDLGFDLTEVGALRCDQGQEFEATAWDGSGPGGHHRSGVLKFAALDHPTSFVEVVIRDVAKVPERVFRWDVPGEVQSPADGNVTQSSTPQPPSAAADGPARVALSDQEFHFGDVVMSRGAVEQTIDITNTGVDVLRIEGVEPT
jgi:hypothetical protein